MTTFGTTSLKDCKRATITVTSGNVYMSEQPAGTWNAELGLDYGVRPRLAILGDVEFPSLLARSIKAVGYGVARQRGVIVDAPLLTLFFESEPDARDLFQRFRTWSQDAFYARGVRFSFIEYEDGSFGLCVVQDESALLDRLLPSDLRDEVEPIILALGYLKRFPKISESYQSFKAFAREKPVVIRAMSTSGALPDCELTLKTLSYYNAATVPENSVERHFIEGKSQPKKPWSPSHGRSARSFDPNEIRARRNLRLRRFFPVTLIRLRASGDFLNAEKRLMTEGYASWQILQAACNLTLPARYLGLDDTGLQESIQENERLNAVDVFQRLLGSHEDVQLRLDSRLTNCDMLRHQIDLDSRHLEGAVSDEDQKEVSTSARQWLAEHGLL